MRSLFILIVAVAAGYLAYTYYEEYVGTVGEPQIESSSEAERQPSSGGATPKAAPVFESKIDVPPGPPGEKRLAQPGIFYMLKRVSVETPTGVHAVVPGEEVRLLKRTGDVLKLAHGTMEFEVKASQVTNDLDQAQEAERADFAAHPRRR